MIQKSLCIASTLNFDLEDQGHILIHMFHYDSTHQQGNISSIYTLASYHGHTKIYTGKLQCHV